MGVAKRTHQPKPAAKAPAKSGRPAKPTSTQFSGVPGAFGLKAKAKKGRPAAGNREVDRPQPPLTDEQVGPISGLPTETEIEQQAGDLSPADKRTFAKIRQILAAHLGSYAAARAWLTTPEGGFDGTPLEAIRSGSAAKVLELLKAQWGRSSSYA
jgi:hypothetical protein